ncbi:MAG: glycosyltransferase family A protein [Bryobacterales bacterium]|nr:glycosyltransferase family A protein [Bryobacterales bacterium]
MAVGTAEPLISVIVPVYNATGSLHRSLRSVLRQTLPDFELIVVDDCSTDGSADILRGYEALDHRVRVLSTEKNSGPGVARNVGLRNARGRYIAFLDSDDFWMKNKLEKQVLSFNNQDVILSCTSTVLLNPEGEIRGIISGRPKVYLKDMNLANRVTMSSAMFRKDLNGAETMPRIRSRQDYAYWISLLQNNHGHIAGVQEPLVGYVKMPGSVSSNAWRNLVDTFRMYVSELGLSPMRAAAAVVLLSCLKLRKEVWARMSWFCMPREERRRLQDEVQEYWQPQQARQAS